MLALRTRSWRSTLLVAIFAIAVALAHGCSNDDAPSNGITVTCAEACARCLTSDICSDCAGWGIKLRDAFEGALYACVVRAADTDAGCPHDWERCLAEAIGITGERASDRAFRDACLARRTECQNSGTGFADDSCLTSAAFVDSVVTEAQQCLVKTCTEVSACLRGAFE